MEKSRKWISRSKKKTAEREIEKDNGNGKILVVDDDHNLLELARMRLESASYDVSTALTEEQAVEAVKSGAGRPLSIVACSSTGRTAYR